MRTGSIYCGCREHLTDAVKPDELFYKIEEMWFCKECTSLRCPFCVIHEPLYFYCSRCLAEYTTKDVIELGGICSKCNGTSEETQLQDVLASIEQNFKQQAHSTSEIKGGPRLRARSAIKCKSCKNMLCEPKLPLQSFDFKINESALNYIPKFFLQNKQFIAFNLGETDYDIELATDNNNDDTEHIAPFKVPKPSGQRPPPFLGIREPIMLKHPPNAGWASTELTLDEKTGLVIRITGSNFKLNLYAKFLP